MFSLNYSARVQIHGVNCYWRVTYPRQTIRATVHLTVALRGSLFLVQRNAEFLAEHVFDGLRSSFIESKLLLDIGMPRFRTLPSEC
jgi:hypothetical protein